MKSKNFIVQIQDSLLAQFLLYWIEADKPCSLLFQSPREDKTSAITFIKTTISSIEADDFLEIAKEKTGCRLLKVS